MPPTEELQKPCDIFGEIDAMNFKPHKLNQKMILNSHTHETVVKVIEDMSMIKNNYYSSMIIDLTYYMLYSIVKDNLDCKKDMMRYEDDIMYCNNTIGALLLAEIFNENGNDLEKLTKEHLT